VRLHHPFIAPPPLAKPTLLQYYWTAIAQYTPRHRPPFVCQTLYNIGDGNIVSTQLTLSNPCLFQWRDRGAALLCALPKLARQPVGDVATVKWLM